jgi:hypothetical protein
LLSSFLAVCDAYWMPTPGTTFQIQLVNCETVDTSFNVQAYEVDLFDTPTTTITQLKNAGRKVICYFSAGSYEDWRPDAGQFPASILGKPLDGWEGENWLNVSKFTETSALGTIMKNRMNLAVQKGCDAIDPDNVDGYTQDSGFVITYNDQLVYNRWFTTYGHSKGLAVGLKNDAEQMADLVSYYDFSVNEECFEYNECNVFLPFINQNKPVFNIEYNLATSAFCPQANTMRFSSQKKDYDLDATPTTYCWTQTSSKTGSQSKTKSMSKSKTKSKSASVTKSKSRSHI